MDRRADVVHLLDAADGPGQHGRLADITDHYLVDAQATQLLGRSLRSDAGSNQRGSREQLRDQQLALIAIGGSNQNHGVPFTRGLNCVIRPESRVRAMVLLHPEATDPHAADVPGSEMSSPRAVTRRARPDTEL